MAAPGAAPPVKPPLRSLVFEGLCRFAYRAGILWLGVRIRRLVGGGAPRILCYHRVARDGFPATLHSDRFDRHLGHLESNYTVVTASRIAASLAGGGPLPGDAVAITFDDGYRCLLEEALPPLREHGMKATFFVLSGHLPGRGFLFLDRIRGTPLEGERRRLAAMPSEERERVLAGFPGDGKLALMDAGDVRRLLDEGHEVGSHGRTHGMLSGLPAEEVVAEVRDSRVELRERAGIEAALFAYPWGAAGREGAAAAREAGYAAAFTTAGSAARPGADPMELPRIHVPGNASVARLACEVSGLAQLLRKALP